MLAASPDGQRGQLTVRVAASRIKGRAGRAHEATALVLAPTTDGVEGGSVQLLAWQRLALKSANCTSAP